jgi:hypothetical protein
MKLTYIFVALGLIVVTIALVALLMSWSDIMRRRRGEGPEAGVIADSEVEFEADVGKTPPGP